MTFSYPKAWQAATWLDVSSFSGLIVALSTARQKNPCTVTVISADMTRADCGQPVSALAPGKILVKWSADGFPSWHPPAANTTVGGLPAQETHVMASWCGGLGGTQTITVVIPIGGQPPITGPKWTPACAARPCPRLRRR